MPGSIDDAKWRRLLTGTDPDIVRMRRFMQRIPTGPRCKLCSAPFEAPGKYLLRPFGYKRWPANRALCQICARGLDKERGGAEVEACFLFADIRGSTTIAEHTSPSEFHALLERFYMATGKAVDHAGGLVDKYMGDGVVAIFLPAFAGGREPARMAIEAAQEILRETGNADGADAWLPVGAGVNCGPAFVGVKGVDGGALDFTGVGDTVNTAARLGSEAAAGEILASTAALERAAIGRDGLEIRHLALKGKEELVDAAVLLATTDLAEPVAAGQPA
jgi:adenylate cyclase